MSRTDFKKKRSVLLIFFLVAIFLLVLFNLFFFTNSKTLTERLSNGLTPADIAGRASPAPTSLPTPKPSPRPLTFGELNALHGPCVNLPVLYYHHIQNMDVAKAAGQQNLTVATNIFIQQMQYLKDHGYVTVATNAITDFFDRGITPSHGSVILTFDDGYEDFYVNVLPILRQFGFSAVMALPTGLTGNPGYLTWDELGQAASSNIEIVNHTWSHANLNTGNTALVEKEIMTADQQLTERGYNPNKAFVYPYGSYNAYTISFLQSKGYTMAFTTVPGSTLCKKQRFVLPRIRVGNASLSAYGF